MPSYLLRLDEPRPYFAEIPYYVWGEVNYDSEGDCQRPTDREWTWIELCHRETNETFTISQQGAQWVVEGPDPLAARTAYFLVARCGAVPQGQEPERHMGDWDHTRAAARAACVKAEFERPELGPFDNGHLFWGSWKWIGWFGTEFTWVGRWIMDAVVRDDPRAVNLSLEWLREGTCHESQSAALRYALARLTGQAFATDQEWIDWYDNAGGRIQFPEPDINIWYSDLKRLHEE